MAKKFRFRLEKLLDLRQKAADSAKVALSEALRAEQEQIDICLEAENRVEKFSTEPQPQKTSIREMESRWYHLRALKNELSLQQNKLNQVREIVSVRRNELAQALQNVKALENLKEKKLEEYQKLIADEEQKLMDEIAQRSRSQLI